MELADKPGSVVSNHSSGIRVTTQLKQPTQKPRGPRVSRRIVSLFGLAPGGVFPATYVAISAVRSYRTISPLPSRNEKAVYFLWHFPSTRAAQMLSGTLPYGARTFLQYLVN